MRRCSRLKFQAMSISSTASSALLPAQGAPAACELWPVKLYSTDTMPVPPPSPQFVLRLDPTCVKSTASTSLKMPPRTKCAFDPSASSATPGHSMIVPGSFSRCMIFLSASAAVMISAWPALCPSPCPGAPTTSSFRVTTPGVWFVVGSPSMSVPSAMIGRPDPYFPVQDVGTPATAR